MSVLHPEVAEGVEELERDFGLLGQEPDGAGGVYVEVGPLPLGPAWNQAESPLTFHLPYNYPSAAPYPFYLPEGMAPIGDWPSALQAVQWRDRQVLQVSLRHNNWNPDHDRVSGSVLQVIAWLRDPR